MNSRHVVQFTRLLSLGVLSLAACVSTASAQSSADRTFPAAPQAYDTSRDGIEKGRIERIEYDSSIVTAKRPAIVYTPPGYSADREYPVLYLLHGIGGNETNWTERGAANVILDNLIADGKAVPMVVVMPSGRASDEPVTFEFGRGGGPGARGRGDAGPEGADGGAPGGAGPGRQEGEPRGGAMGVEFRAYAAFERELIDDLIPYIEEHYSVSSDREDRAIAGLSMGGGQSLNFGLGNIDVFGSVGGFSSAPNTSQPAELVPDLAMARRELEVLWVSCGDEDSLFNISEGVHTYLAENDVPHIWHIDSGGHTFPVWKNDLYHFASLLFQ